jgi:hypothetical protein
MPLRCEEFGCYAMELSGDGWGAQGGTEKLFPLKQVLIYVFVFCFSFVLHISILLLVAIVFREQCKTLVFLVV